MSRPCPVKIPPPRRARAMGMRKRRVDPDSPQLNSGKVLRFVFSSSIHRRVARMSWEPARLCMTLPSPAKAAAMRQRWAWDLLGGGVTVPASFPRVMVRFIGRPP